VKVNSRGVSAQKLVFLYASSVLGAGILFVPGLTVQSAGWLAIPLWVVLALACVAIATLFADISTRFPTSSGIHQVVERGLGRPLARYVDVVLLVVYVVGNPAMGIASAQYLAAVTWYEPIATRAGEALVAMGFMTLSLCMSVLPNRVVGTVQSWTMRIAIFAILLASALAVPHMDLSHVTQHEAGSFTGVVTAAGIAFYAYLGWENVSLLADRVEDPKRAFRYAIARAVPIVAVVYLVAVVAYAALPAGSPPLLLPALTEQLPAAVRIPLLAASLAAIVAATNAWVLGGAALFERAARQLAPASRRLGLLARVTLALGYAVVLAGAALGLFRIDGLLSGTSALFLTVYALVAYSFIRLTGRVTWSAVSVLLITAVMLLAHQPLGGLLAALTVIVLLIERHRHDRSHDHTVQQNHADRPGPGPGRVRDDVPARLPG